MAKPKTRLSVIIKKFEQEILSEWMSEQLAAVSRQKMLMQDAELKGQCGKFLTLFTQALQGEHFDDLTAPEWGEVRGFLGDISRSRGMQGFTPSETAAFVFSLKRPIFTRLRKEIRTADQLADEIWIATELLDQLGLYTTEVFQKSREEIIIRQQQEALELSTPVVKLWDGVLALPLIGTLDSARTQVVMESLLQRIVETGSSVAILDITGVPTVDTLVAQHLIKTVTAARLMGADCIISGIRPQIAQTIVHLGIALNTVSTKANLADAFQLALQKCNLAVRPVGPEAAAKKEPARQIESEKE